MTRELRCWCGNADLQPFSPQYLHCAVCESLVLAAWPEASLAAVRNDAEDFYGKRYWFEHQEQDLGQSNLLTRVRQDLPERCVFWLRTLLSYKVPPGRSLELGCAHGAFVALLNWAGFSASGLELSPWVADFARRTFGIKVLVGPVESQPLERESLDLIVATDVIEHLDAPLDTIQHCVGLLKPDGLLMLQTPCYPAGETYEAMVAAESPFLAQLKAPEHTYLLSQGAIREMLRRAGLEHAAFEPAIFAHYDMFLVAGRQPFARVDQAQQEERLAETSSGRLTQGLLDLYADRDIMQRELAAETAHVGWLKHSMQELERDRAARLTVLESQGAQLGQISALEADIEHLKAQVLWIEQDRAARLDVIERQGQELGRIGSLEADVEYLKQQIVTMEADRAARLGVIELQQAELARMRPLEARLDEMAERAAQVGADLTSKNEIVQDQQRELGRLATQVAQLQAEAAVLARSRLLRLLRKVGLFQRQRS